ncbi:MAG: ribosome maturation factor RimM [Sulfurovaceae bacterium]|nr:ribosome maturation factor RimM [Sulfurovaceae bacterium]MDD5548048.1 ribosome maturation factor RimM [Sulfurovaceae bacterium]
MSNIFIAQIGKTVGLHGDIKLHIHSDFPQQFKVGSQFQTDRGIVEFIKFDQKNSLARFKGYESLESAKKLTNAKIYTTLEQTKENCDLDEGQYFWFDIIGCKVIENGETLGIVKDIERFTNSDYLEITTDEALAAKDLPKSFLIPYVSRYISSVSLDTKEIFVIDAKSILENS